MGISIQVIKNKNFLMALTSLQVADEPHYKSEEPNGIRSNLFCLLKEQNRKAGHPTCCCFRLPMQNIYTQLHRQTASGKKHKIGDDIQLENSTHRTENKKERTPSD